jgi:acyl dehydratase
VTTVKPMLLFDEVHVGEELPTISYDVTATTVVLGAIGGRDWRPMHHDHHFAVDRNGVRDIFLNSTAQAAWFERFVTDWTGPTGRLGQLGFRMRSPVFPGETMVIRGHVVDVGTDDTGCGWVDIEFSLDVDGDARATGRARVALPRSEDDNPWVRRGERWNPQRPARPERPGKPER